MAKAEAVVEVSVRVHGESVAALTQALEDAEQESLDFRRLFNEEVQAHAETLTRESDAWALYYHVVERARKRRLLDSDRIDELEAREFIRQKRGKWVGVAVATAFALGGYVGFLIGFAQ
jgi:hypothetical protein